MKDQDLLERPITDFKDELSSRAYNVLFYADIGTIGELVAKDEDSMRKLRHCGRVVLTEIKAFLFKYGLSFSLQTEDDSTKLKNRILELELILQQNRAEIQRLGNAAEFAQRYDQLLSRTEAVVQRLETEVGLFSNLMFKLLSKERRAALAQEIERLDSGEIG